MDKKTIQAVIEFSQSKTYKSDWKIRLTFKDNYKTILIHDIINKDTKFGESPDTNAMRMLAVEYAQNIADGFGSVLVVDYK